MTTPSFSPPEIYTTIMIRLVVVSGLLCLFSASVQGTDCPGGLVRCPSFMTCCELANKEYGCCPFPNAMCCKDHVHCCPENMQCDVAQQTCRKNGSPLQFYWRVPIQPELIESNVELLKETVPEESNRLREVRGDSCPDGHPCPSIYTCCKMYKGGFGCCPFENAQCCSDGFHCCPVGSQCNATTGGCDHKTHKFTLDPYPLPVKKATEKPRAGFGSQPLRSGIADPGGKCPDGHPCPEKFTCCKVPDQGYGCCPYSEAVCCTDYIHCCPKGTNCNTTLGTCDVEKRKSLSVPAFSLVTKQLAHVPHIPKKEEVQKTASNVSSVVCPDEQYLCPDGNTCCQLQSGAYGCCPMDHATCCSDHMNCCPHGYRCFAGGCELNPAQDDAPLIRKISPAKKTAKKEPQQTDDDLQIVICPDKLSVCPDENTCCDIGGGFYGCCPMPKATCCEDKAHCCPHGYHCSSAGCEKASENSLQLVHLHFTNISETIGEVKSYKEPENDVICPDKEYSCPDGNTCCSVGGGEYGCCPMPKATCCSDQEHCCPHGYTCKDGGCEREPGLPFALPAFTPKLFLKKEKQENERDYPQVMLLP
ncbi:putative granulins-like isoform X3 [Penaeus vannamei]|uniref:Putative granulins-like isoform X3 n=1 Tax=Penaeus vannamei TaxID=6689 RepID=A0A3R7P5Q2_PENVA|nr:putative granulins-like isoform X3 [Penaeus vannamei]